MAVGGVPGRKYFDAVLADGDFDAEWVHRDVRSFGIRAVVPAEQGRSSEGPSAGK